MKKSLKYCMPEDVGVSSAAVMELLENLELGDAEPHSLMIMRHGKVCVQGWWKPFSPGLRHGMQSFTKTLCATAIGIAYTKNQLKLDEKLADIFPDKIPADAGSNLKELQIRHVLSMSNGAEKVPSFEGDWIKNFFRLEFVHKPGTAFFYNSVGTTLLGAILERKTGKRVQEYLTENLYPNIGINPDDVAWIRLKDGLEIGGNGAYLRTEDMVKLMKLYLDGGIADGRRILSAEYVSLATSVQTDNTDPTQNPNAHRKDWGAGYGYQIWMCSHKGAYRADGAMGQFSIVIPDLDMIIACTETSLLGDGAQASLNILWNFVNQALASESEVTEENQRRLKNRLSRLSLPALPYQPHGNKELFEGSWKIADGSLYLDPSMGGIMDEYYPRRRIQQFALSFMGNEAVMEYDLDGEPVRLAIGLDGNARQNTVPCGGIPAGQLLMSASFEEEDHLSIICRFVETCFCFVFDITAKGNELMIHKSFLRGQVKDNHLDISARRK